LVGGIFVHVPFLLMPELAPAERIGRFRATESLMLKSGSAFVEVLLLNKKVMELAGYCQRITELFEALDKGTKETVLQALNSGGGER
jgi:hypothetical protein